MLSTTNQFTALWILVVAVAFILEIGAGLVRGLLWFAGGNGRDLCTSIWSTFLPEESEVCTAAYLFACGMLVRCRLYQLILS